jgi:hypothetical protein
MLTGKPALDVWDSCCIIGILNAEKDKLPALLSQTRLFEGGQALLGIPIGAVPEVVTLSDGTPAEQKIRTFMDNAYVVPLLPNLDVSFKSTSLRYRFDSKRMPELKTKAIAAGVPPDRANKLGVKDSEILATALVCKADRLTTYDPFLIFIGKEYIAPETGLIIGPPCFCRLCPPSPPSKRTASPAAPFCQNPIPPRSRHDTYIGRAKSTASSARLRVNKNGCAGRGQSSDGRSWAVENFGD